MGVTDDEERERRFDDNVNRLVEVLAEFFSKPIKVQLTDASGNAIHLVLQPQTPTSNTGAATMSQVPFGIQDNQTSIVELVFEDVDGNPVSGVVIDAGSITVTSSDPAALAATVGADGQSVVATADGALDSDVVVSVTLTVDGAPYSGSETFAVGASAPTQLVLVPGTPTTNA
jgi:hypothetical protein